MATLSDLSGHSVVNEFSEYLTGYPLPEVGAYALAKTWYAPEMPRPGCVWTHTLLIPFARLGNAQSLHSFLSLFQRPRRDKYSTFRLPQSEKSINRRLDLCGPSNSKLNEVGDILRKLYESPERPVLVPLRSPSLAEHAFLYVWSQQWPRLRRAFTFCTGAISARHMEGRWFDLQGIPEKRTDEVIRSNEKAIVAKLEPQEVQIEVGQWYQLAMYDISESTSPFRDFLFEFGAEAARGRRDFIGLANLFLALGDHIDHPENKLLEALELVFPDSNLGVKFKTRLLYGKIGGNVVRSPDFAVRLLLESKENLFSVDGGELREFVRRAVEHDSSTVMAAIESVYERSGNPSTVILSAVADTLGSEHLAGSSKFRNALLALASCRPLLLAQDALRKEPKRNEMLLDYLKSSSIKMHESRLVLSQWLKEDNLKSLMLGAESTPAVVIPGVLDILGSRSESLEDGLSIGDLVQLCEIGAQQSEEWLFRNIQGLRKEEVSARVVACVVVAIEISAIRISTKNVEDWEYLLANQHELDYELGKTLLIKIFCRAMKLQGKNGARIATAAFPHLYRLLFLGKFSYGEWSALQEKSMGVRWDWNECRRFTEGLIDQFKDCRWPKRYFSIMLANHADLAVRLMETRFFRAKYRKFVLDCLN